MANNLTLTLNNGAVMPAFGLGTWMMDGAVIETAIRAGYRHFDVSGFHGNQADIGVAVQKLFREGVVKREELFFIEKLGAVQLDSKCRRLRKSCITSLALLASEKSMHGHKEASIKAAGLLLLDCMFALQKSARHAPEEVEVDVRENLKLLKLDYLDCLQVHPFTSLTTLSSDDEPAYDPERFAKTWQAMEAVVNQGLVKSIGVTNFSIKKLENLLKTAKIVPAVNQIEFHPYLQQNKLRKYCQSKGIVVEAYAPLGSSGRSGDFKKEGEPKVLEDAIIGQIATKHKATPAQICIAYALHLGLAVVPKSSKKQHLIENFEAQEVRLDAGDVDQLRGLEKNLKLFDFGFLLRPGQTLEGLWDVAEDEAFVLD